MHVESWDTLLFSLQNKEHEKQWNINWLTISTYEASASLHVKKHQWLACSNYFYRHMQLWQREVEVLREQLLNLQFNHRYLLTLPLFMNMLLKYFHVCCMFWINLWDYFLLRGGERICPNVFYYISSFTTYLASYIFLFSYI